MKHTIKETSIENTFNTSFHDLIVRASKNEIVEKLGVNPKDNYPSKTNYNWALILNDTFVFTIYDYKEERRIKVDDIIEFHIGWKQLFFINGDTSQNEIDDKTGFPTQLEACEMIEALEERGLTVDHSSSWKVFHENSIFDDTQYDKNTI